MFDGLLAFDDAIAESRPGVLVCHTWGGRGPFEDDTARRIAGLGYPAFSLDLFGKGVRGASREENRALIKPFLENRALLAARLQLAVETMGKQAPVKAERIAAIGFCFGGLCALDLARNGTGVAGVVSFHGLFKPPPGGSRNRRITARVLALHGWDDPMVPPDDVLALAGELTAAGADWQIHAYGNTMHAFTNPNANDPAFGTVYNAQASDRAWNAMQAFLSELFANSPAA